MLRNVILIVLTAIALGIGAVSSQGVLVSTPAHAGCSGRGC
jgi:hypothetical protein